MKVIEFEFNVGTCYVGSTVKDIITLEFDDDATEEEIDKAAGEAWVEWRAERCDGGWVVKSEKIIED
jgi:hypothetical protein